MQQLLSRLDIKYYNNGYNQNALKSPLADPIHPTAPEKARILPPARHAPRGRDGNYGNAVLATTGGQRRVECPRSVKRNKNNRSQKHHIRFTSREHSALLCPNVE